MQDSEMNSSVAEIDGIFSEVKDSLARNDNAEDLKGYAAKLAAAASAQVLMDRLARYLFAKDLKVPLSNEDALAVLQFLVASDPQRYLKSASKAVETEAVRLSKSQEPMVVSTELMNLLVAQLSGTDVQVSQNSASTIVACCKKLGQSFGDKVLQSIAEAWRKAWNAVNVSRNEASVIAVRCASAIVDLVCLSDSMMKSAQTYGDLRLLLTMLTDESDPLLEMSTLDLLQKLVTTLPMHQERAKWLFSPDVLIPLLQMAGGTEQGFPDPTLGGTAVITLANLCKLGHQDSSLIENSKVDVIQAFHLALHNFEVSGELDRMALVDAISSVASASPEGLERVLNDPVTRQTWLALNVAQPKLKAVILYSVSMVLDPKDEVDANGDVVAVPAPSDALGMKLFSTLGQVNGQEAPSLALSFAKSPLPEVRLSAYALLTAVAKLSSGGKLLFQHPDFFAFLMDRDAEKTKEGREAKFEIVQAVVGNEVKGLLAADIVKQLEEYIKQGPHYAKAMAWELATEDA